MAYTHLALLALEYWVQLLFNFTPVSVRQVQSGPKCSFRLERSRAERNKDLNKATAVTRPYYQVAA